MTAQYQNNNHGFSRAAEGTTRPTMLRRQFLRVMGLAGAAALLGSACTLRRAIDAQLEASPTPASITAQLEATPTPQPAPTAVPSAASNPCTVQCPAQCAYPGKCRRYVDSNRNGLCDNGECL